MDLYTKLAEIFEISELNLDRSNRRTLLKYAKRTKFQKRREAFYSVCDEGTKSKVAICKTDDRPTWVDNLETLKTKKLREQLKSFLKELGVLENPKYANLKKLAREKNWHHVVYLDDETKQGAGGTDDEDDNWGADSAPVSPRRMRDMSPGMQDARRRQEHASRASPIKRSRRRAGRAVGAPARRERAAAVAKPHQVGWVNSDAAGNRLPEVQTSVQEYQQRLPMHQLTQQDVRGWIKDAFDQRARDHRLDRVEKLLRHGMSRKEEVERIQDVTRPLLTQLQETQLEKSDVLTRPEEPTFEIGGGGGQDLAPRETRIQVINTGNRSCVFTQEEEECVCKPTKVKLRDMSSDTKDRLKDLAEQKAIACSKIDLLRCLSVEYTQQMKTWKIFNENCQGDFLAKFTAHQVKELTCGKYPVFSGPDLHTMKAVAQCFAASKNLCKGHSDVMARFEDEKAIDKEYTMGHLCYDDVLAGVRKFGDRWYKAAYRNRKPDPVPTRQMICSEPGKPDQIVQIPVQDPEVPVVVPPNTMIAQPAVGAMPSIGGLPGVGGPSGGGSVMPGGPTMHIPTSTPVAPVPATPLPPAPSQLPPSVVPGQPPVVSPPGLPPVPSPPGAPVQPVQPPNVPPGPGPGPPPPMPRVSCDMIMRHVTEVAGGITEPQKEYFLQLQHTIRDNLKTTKIDQSILWFIVRHLTDLNEKKWRVNPVQKDALLDYASKACNQQPIPVPSGPTDPCDWYNWAMQLTNNSWIPLAHFVELYNETARLWLNSRVAHKGMKKDRAKWLSMGRQALQRLQTCFNDGGWSTQEVFAKQLRHGLELCEADRKTWKDSGTGWGDKDDPKMNRCQRMVTTILGLTGGPQELMFSYKGDAKSELAASLGTIPRSVPQWLIEEMRAYSQALPNEVVRTINPMIDRFIQNPRSLTGEEVKTMSKFLYGACQGRLGHMPDELCARIDFYLILDFYSQGLHEREWTELYDDLIPQLLGEATQTEEQYIDQFMLNWRFKRLKGERPTKGDLQQFRRYVYDICTRRKNPHMEITVGEDYCRELLRDLQNLHDGRILASDKETVLQRVHSVLREINEDVTREVAFNAMNHIASGQKLKPQLLNGLKQFIYAHCMGTEMEWQNICVQIDFLLIAVSLTGLSGNALDFFVQNATRVAQGIVVKAAQERAMQLIEHIAKHPTDELAADDESFLRKELWDACNMSNLGEQQLGPDEEMIDAQPGGDRGVKPNLDSRPTYPVGFDWPKIPGKQPTGQPTGKQPTGPTGQPTGTQPTTLPAPLPALPIGRTTGQTTKVGGPIQAYNVRPGLDRKLAKAKRKLNEFLRLQRKYVGKDSSAKDRLLQRITQQRQLIGRLKQSGAKEQTMADFAERHEVSAVLEEPDPDAQRVANMLLREQDRGLAKLNSDIERLKRERDPRGWKLELTKARVLFQDIRRKHQEQIVSLKQQGYSDEQIANHLEPNTANLKRAEQDLLDVWEGAKHYEEQAGMVAELAKAQARLDAGVGDKELRRAARKIRHVQEDLRYLRFDDNAHADRVRKAMRTLEQLYTQARMAAAEAGVATDPAATTPTAPVYPAYPGPGAPMYTGPGVPDWVKTGKLPTTKPATDPGWIAYAKKLGYVPQADGSMVHEQTGIPMPHGLVEGWKFDPSNPQRLVKVANPRLPLWAGKTYAELQQMANAAFENILQENNWERNPLGGIRDKTSKIGVPFDWGSDPRNPLRGVSPPISGQENLPAVWTPGPGDYTLQQAPAQTAPAQTVPAQTVPAQTAPAQTAPAQTAPAVPAQNYAALIAEQTGQIQDVANRRAMDAALQRANAATTQRLAAQQGQQQAAAMQNLAQRRAVGAAVQQANVAAVTGAPNVTANLPPIPTATEPPAQQPQPQLPPIPSDDMPPPPQAAPTQAAPAVAPMETVSGTQEVPPQAQVGATFGQGAFSVDWPNISQEALQFGADLDRMDYGQQFSMIQTNIRNLGGVGRASEDI